MRNYNSLLDRYPGADGMKTGFICASGYNVVASATRNGRRLIAIVLGAYSGAVRAQKAAQLLERGFNSGGLSWLTPSLGTVDALAPIDAQPPNLREEMCGGHAASRRPKTTTKTKHGSRRHRRRLRSGAGLHAVQPAGRRTASSCSGRRSRPSAPVVVFTGPADHPDPVQVAEPRRRRKRHQEGQAPKPKTAPRPRHAKRQAREAEGQFGNKHDPKSGEDPKVSAAQQ